MNISELLLLELAKKCIILTVKKMCTFNLKRRKVLMVKSCKLLTANIHAKRVPWA